MAAITITLTYRSYTVASPTVISATTITVNVPTNLTADAHIKNIFLFGAFTFSDSTGLYTFVPAREIVKITSP